MNVSIIIPAYNEESRIGDSIDTVVSYCKAKFSNYEIIIVDDCSKDNTNKIIKNKAKTNKNIKIFKNEVNRGKGYSVKRGMLLAKYPISLFSDADLATPIEEFDKLYHVLDSGYDVVIASRGLKGSDIKIKQPWTRVALGRVFRWLVSIIAVRGFIDTQCGFKLFKTKVSKKIFSLQTFERFSFDVEILFLAKKLGCKIKEVPVVWIDKKGSKVDPVKDSLRMFRDLFIIKKNDLLGKYKNKK